MSVVFEITERSIEEHRAAAASEDMSAGGKVYMGEMQMYFCIYKGELAWVTEGNASGKEVSDQYTRDLVFSEWLSQMM